jgi:hypothetical protein
MQSSFSLKENHLSVSAQVLSEKDSEAILNYNLPRQGYKPIEITISNESNHRYEISLAATSLFCEKPGAIAWKATQQGLPRGIAFKIMSFFFWPFTAISTLDSIHSLKQHRNMMQTLTAKGLKEEPEIILPYSYVKRLIYVPNHQFFSTFTVCLKDSVSGDLIVIPVTTQT